MGSLEFESLPSKLEKFLANSWRKHWVSSVINTHRERGNPNKIILSFRFRFSVAVHCSHRSRGVIASQKRWISEPQKSPVKFQWIYWKLPPSLRYLLLKFDLSVFFFKIIVCYFPFLFHFQLFSFCRFILECIIFNLISLCYRSALFPLYKYAFKLFFPNFINAGSHLLADYSSAVFYPGSG